MVRQQQDGQSEGTWTRSTAEGTGGKQTFRRTKTGDRSRRDAPVAMQQDKVDTQERTAAVGMGAV